MELQNDTLYLIETSNHNDHVMHKLSLKINNDDNLLVISSTIHRTRMKVEFSEQMKKFLSIKEENVIIGFSGEDKNTTIAIKPIIRLRHALRNTSVPVKYCIGCLNK